MYIFVYTLMLSENEMYVGMTSNPTRRRRDHEKGRGSIHTMGRPVKDWEIRWKGPVKNKWHALLIENAMAKRMKQKYSGYKIYGGELSPRYKKIVIRRALKG